MEITDCNECMWFYNYDYPCFACSVQHPETSEKSYYELKEETKWIP